MILMKTKAEVRYRSKSGQYNKYIVRANGGDEDIEIITKKSFDDNDLNLEVRKYKDKIYLTLGE